MIPFSRKSLGGGFRVPDRPCRGRRSDRRSPLRKIAPPCAAASARTRFSSATRNTRRCRPNARKPSKRKPSCARRSTPSPATGANSMQQLIDTAARVRMVEQRIAATRDAAEAARRKRERDPQIARGTPRRDRGSARRPAAHGTTPAARRDGAAGRRAAIGAQRHHARRGAAGDAAAGGESRRAISPNLCACARKSPASARRSRAISPRMAERSAAARAAGGRPAEKADGGGKRTRGRAPTGCRARPAGRESEGLDRQAGTGARQRHPLGPGRGPRRPGRPHGSRAAWGSRTAWRRR